MDDIIFELILVGEKDKQKIRTIEGLGHHIASYYEFSNCKIRKTSVEVIYMSKPVNIMIELTENILDEIVFRLKVSSSYIIMESLRGIILSLLHKQFSQIYIIRDQVSMELCREAYPLINEVENTLRQYIMHFMILKIGSEWWKYNVTESLKNKSVERDKKSAYSEFVNQDIFHVEFKDLGEFIFNNFSGYKTKNDILKDLSNCKTLEDLNLLKDNALPNWEKYFKEHFDENWKNKWEELSEYRNQIAHNKLIERKTVDKIKMLSELMLKNLKLALEKIEDLNYSKAEIIVIKDNIIKNKSLIVKAAIKNLNDLGYDIDNIANFIEEFKLSGLEIFTSADLVRKINSGKYNVNEDINWSAGRILSTFSEQLGIVSSDESIVIEDDKGSKTSCKAWHII